MLKKKKWVHDHFYYPSAQSQTIQWTKHNSDQQTINDRKTVKLKRGEKIKKGEGSPAHSSAHTFTWTTVIDVDCLRVLQWKKRLQCRYVQWRHCPWQPRLGAPRGGAALRGARVGRDATNGQAAKGRDEAGEPGSTTLSTPRPTRHWVTGTAALPGWPTELTRSLPPLPSSSSLFFPPLFHFFVFLHRSVWVLQEGSWIGELRQLFVSV